MKRTTAKKSILLRRVSVLGFNRSSIMFVNPVYFISLLFSLTTHDHGRADEYALTSVSASSEVWPASRLIDGNTNSCWSSIGYGNATNTESIAFGMAGPQNVNYIRLLPRYSTNAVSLSFPVKFNVYSSSGGVWNLWYTYQDYPNPVSGDWVFLQLPDKRYTDAICVEATTLRSDGSLYRFQLKEVAVGYDPGMPGAIEMNVRTGWDIFVCDVSVPQVYRYGPSIIINDNDRIDMWVASDPYNVAGVVPYAVNTNGGVADLIRHRYSDDGGQTWDEAAVLIPTPGGHDQYSCCDPGVFYANGYYYVGYTTRGKYEVPVDEGNDVMIARALTPRGMYEKWAGNGWSGAPRPVIESSVSWGVGEPSFVVKDGIIYMYYSYVDHDAGVYETRLATASANDANWPAHLKHWGKVLSRGAGEASTDIKYVPEWGLFIGIAERYRLTTNSWHILYASRDGYSFRRVDEIRETFPSSHNSGISGRSDGHLRLSDDNYIAYAYDPTGSNTWAKWNTRMHPIQLTDMRLITIDPAASDNYVEVHQMSNLDRFNRRISQNQTSIPNPADINKEVHLMGDYDGDSIADLWRVQRYSTGSGMTEVHILQGPNYTNYLLHRATALGATSTNWYFDLADHNGDRHPDLYAINTQGSGGKTRVSVLDGSGGSNSFLSFLKQDVQTSLQATDSSWEFSVSDWNGNGNQDLFCIHRDASSGKTEVHVLDGPDFTSFVLQRATVLGTTSSAWTFDTKDWNCDRKTDVFAMNRQGPGGVEVLILDGAGSYTNCLQQIQTGMVPVSNQCSLYIQ